MRRPLPPLYFLIHVLAMIGLNVALPVGRWIQWPWTLIGVVPLLLGLTLNGISAGTFRRHRTTIKPFEEPSQLVTEGPFRINRNPMYLGGLLMLIGIGSLLGSISPLVAIPSFYWLITTQFVVKEEEEMKRRFGQAYLDYGQRVRRWL